MDNALLMCVLDGVTNLREKFQPLFGGKIILIAVVRDFNAAYQLHHEVRPPRIGGTAVENLGNVRMVHERKSLPLGFKARDDLLRVHAELDDLERHASSHRLLLLRHVNDTAAALADLLE